MILQSKGLSRVFLQHHSSKASILQCSAFLMVQLSHLYMTTGKTIAFTVEPSLVAQRVKHLLAMWETRIQSLGWEDPLEKKMATHSSTLAWEIPWTAAHQAPLSTEFSRQERWSGYFLLHFRSQPRDRTCISCTASPLPLWCWRRLLRVP